MQLEESESRDDVSDSSVATEDSYTYTWQAAEFVRCPGWAWHPCAHSMLIKRGCTKCHLCKRAKAVQKKQLKAARRYIEIMWNEEDDSDESVTDFEESDPEGNNVTFRVGGGNVMVAEGGDSFTRSQAIAAAIDVARALAANGERGFEELIEPGHETQVVRKTVGLDHGQYINIVDEMVCRIAYVADPNVLPYNTVKAASILGGVRVRPPIVLGKARMPCIGQIYEGIHARFLQGMLEEIVDRMQLFTTSERDQIKALSKFDDDAIAICCNAVLAAAAVASLKETNNIKIETCHLKWHRYMFHGGHCTRGEPPHLAVSMFMDWRHPHPIKKRCITRTLRARYNPHPCG